MSKKSLEVKINPGILRWARESAGWTIEEISKKLRISKSSYESWEAGKPIRLKTLEKIAGYFKRSFAVFFLPEVPSEPPLTTSFRVLPKEPQLFSKELRLAIRRSRRLESIANDLTRNLGIETKTKIRKVTLDKDPVEIAQIERKQFGISIEEQFHWPNAFEAFKAWRGKIEEQNILVFQVTMPIEDARGFSIMDTQPYAIVVNSSDNILARIFTLLHEYAHLLLQIPEIYSPDEETLIGEKVDEVENWANNFAGEFLIPEEVAKDSRDFQSLTISISPEPLLNVSRKFKVSKHAVLTRMLNLKLISREKYYDESAKLQQEPKSREDEKFFPPAPPQKCIREKGRLFTSLVLENKQKGYITYTDVADFLSIKTKHIDELQSLLGIYEG